MSKNDKNKDYSRNESISDESRSRSPSKNKGNLMSYYSDWLNFS